MTSFRDDCEDLSPMDSEIGVKRASSIKPSGFGSFGFSELSRIPEHSRPDACNQFGINTRLLTFQRLTNLPGYAKSNHSHQCYSPPRELSNHSF